MCINYACTMQRSSHEGDPCTCMYRIMCMYYVVVPDPQQSVGNGSSGFCGRNSSVSYSLDVVAML